MIKAVLFDLDGTLADTAPDLGYALNRQRLSRGLPALSLEQIRPQASAGARGLLKLGFNLNPQDQEYPALREEFLDLYSECLYQSTKLFEGITELLEEIEKRAMPWGIVTNKPQRFTLPLLERLQLTRRAACVVSGDTCANPKPHPEPLLAASRAIGLAPQECIYVGDDKRDTEACLAAGMRSLIAGWGYLGNGSDPKTWGAHVMIDKPQDLLGYL